jgi:hypothetical protein
MTQDQKKYKEYKVLSESLGPKLQQELRDAFPKAARRHDVSVAYGAGLDREQNLSMQFYLQCRGKPSEKLLTEMVAHAQVKTGEWAPRYKAEVRYQPPAHFDHS